MNKLVKAEWYRLRKSGTFLFYIVLVCILCVAVALLGNRKFFESDLSTNAFAVLFGVGSFMYPVFISTMLCVVASMGHHSKVAYYEIMDGNKTSHIILSKHIVYLPIVLCLFLIPMLSLLGYSCVKNGSGELIDKPIWFFVLFAAIILRIVIGSINIAMVLKKLVTCAVFSYGRMFIEALAILPFQIIGETQKNSDILKIADFIKDVTVSFQIENLTTNCNDTRFIVLVIASAVFEIVFGYCMAYRSYKKKKFN